MDSCADRVTIRYATMLHKHLRLFENGGGCQGNCAATSCLYLKNICHSLVVPLTPAGASGFVLVVAGKQPDAGLEAEAERVLALLLGELPLKSAARLAAEITGASKNALYARALELREGGG